VVLLKKPLFGMLKCNMDATSKYNKVGTCMCVRDHKGNNIKAKTISFLSYLQVKDGEAFGLLQVIKLIDKLGLNNVIFDIDAKQMVDSFNDLNLDLSPFGFIVRDCFLHFSNLCSNSLVGLSRR